MPRTNYYALLDLRQLAPDLLVRCPLLIVDLDKIPTHDTFGIDHERGRVRPTTAIRVEDAVTIDHFVILVFEEWKVEVAVEPFAEHLAEFFRLLVIIGADGENLHLFFFLLGQ